MLNIAKNREGEKVTFALNGRLDTTTAPQLEAEITAALPGTEQMVLDFTRLEYISSAGLRVLLMAQKAMNKQGKLTLRGVNETIQEVFDITGFSDILTFE